MWRFKRRFLLIYSTKSQTQMLRRCGNECRTQWDRETQEGRCLNRSIALISNSTALQIRRTCLFIGHLGVTVRSKRSTVMMERSTVDRFKNIVAVGSWWTVWMKRLRCVYKMPRIAPLGSRSDGCDALLGHFIRAVITPWIKAHALMWFGGPWVHAIHARISNAPSIQRFSFCHVSCT